MKYSTFRATGVLEVGEELVFESPGVNGDGHFYKYTGTVVAIASGVVTIRSEHWPEGTRDYRVVKGRSSYYIQEV